MVRADPLAVHDATLVAVNDGEMGGVTSGRPAAVGDLEAVTPLLRMTRVLVGIATHAVEQLDGGVSLPQFRLLLTLSDLGPAPSAEVAERLGSAASSVTRLADHLEDAGYLVRRRERPNRSVVRLELTPAGAELVERVVTWRAAELERLVAELPARSRPQLARLVARFCDAAEPAYGSGRGPVPI